MPRIEASLAQRIAGQIVDLATAQSWDVGRHLPEVALATRYSVSRSPVRAALTELARIGVAEWRPNRGFFLRLSGADLAAASRHLARGSQDSPYMRIAADRLAGELPETITKTLLQRRYGLRALDAAKILARMAQEGWIARRPGYGWSFLPVLTSLEAHKESFRFRMAVEPAALLEPGYRVDKEAFARCRAQQRQLVEGRITDLTSAELFELGSRLHQTLVACSNNPFFVDALTRVNRLRRLIEYRAMIDTAQFLPQAREHLRLLDMVEGGDRKGAADLLRRHLEGVSAVKLGALASNPPRPTTAPRPADQVDESVALIHF